MANTIRIKRRNSGGAGAPASLKSGEFAWNGVDDTLYYGKGDDGSGNATSIVVVGGIGAFMALTGAQTIAGVKTFTSPPVIPAAVNSNEPYQKGQADTLLATKAPLASPALTGTPTAPTAAAGTSTTQIATTAFVESQKGAANGLASLGGDGKVPSAQLPSSVVGAVAYQGTWNASTNTPAIPAAASGNKGFYYKVATAGSTSIDGETDWKIGDWIISDGAVWSKVDNTESVSSVAGRTGAVTLAYADISGLASMAQQAASAVAITGGTIDGVTLDGGSF